MLLDGQSEFLEQREEALSKGFHGGIHLPSDREKGLYPGAELVKETKTEDPFEAERAFLELRIAGILFPGRVIDVVGFEALQPEGQFPHPFLQRLYSKKADMPNGHSKFSTDMNRMDRGLGKVSTCSCPECVEHREFHEQSGFDGKFNEEYNRMQQAGILPAGESDPSDYCLTPNGIIFFEIKDFFPRKVRAFLDSQAGAIADPQVVLKMLERYDEIPTVEQVTGRPRR